MASTNDLSARTFPRLVPVPKLDCHIILSPDQYNLSVSAVVSTHACGQDERLCRVYSDGANVIGVSFELRHLLGGVVVVYAQAEVIRAYGIRQLGYSFAASGVANLRLSSSSAQ